jgi:ABC-2 type transport system ATP-binding protein
MIECTGITKRFGDRVVLDQLSLTAGRGEVVALLGGNGAGKTTLLRILAGRLLADSGSARIDGIDPGRDPRRLAGTIGAVLSQPSAWYLRLDALQNLELFGVAQGLTAPAARSAATSQLDAAGLSEHARRAVGTYSQGMRARLAIARALLADPAVLLLDEPTAGVDATAAAALIDHLRAHRAARTVIMATHSLEETAAVADRAALLDRGKLVALLPVPDDALDLTDAVEAARCA